MKLKAIFFTLLALPVAAIADNSSAEKPKNRMDFSVVVEKEVALDVLQVKLFVQDEHVNLNTLHNTISAKLNAALAKINAVSAVTIKSNDRNTSVRYNNKGRKDGWVERAELVLESRDSYALSQVLDEVSEQLSIEYVNALLSVEAKEKLEDELTQQALAKFLHKADLIQTGLKVKGYRILSLQMDNFDPVHHGETRHYAAFEVSSKMSSAPVVQLETGKTKMRKQIGATIELIQD